MLSHISSYHIRVLYGPGGRGRTATRSQGFWNPPELYHSMLCYIISSYIVAYIITIVKLIVTSVTFTGVFA